MSGHLSKHLTEKDICLWTAGERGLEAERHLESCAACRSQVALMSEVLGGFRASVHLAANSTPQITPRASNGFAWARLAFATLALLFIAAAVWLPRNNPASRTTDDAALLKRVDAEVSRTVPGPMEPLTALIEWREDR